MTKRTTRAAKRRPAPEGDPGQYLPLLAVSHADRARRPKEPLSWSEALAAAPWGPELPPAWERAFREAYARRLVELGSALPAKRGGVSGVSQTEQERAGRGVGRLNLRIAQSAIAKLDRDAKRIGCSRAKLIESLIVGFEG